VPGLMRRASASHVARLVDDDPYDEPPRPILSLRATAGRVAP
jgi:hypothetical protein